MLDSPAGAESNAVLTGPASHLPEIRSVPLANLITDTGSAYDEATGARGANDPSRPHATSRTVSR